MTTYGWDMSHFDAPSIGNALSQGIQFITHKAGGDSSSGDAELDDWWANVKNIPDGQCLLGAYWVLRPDRGRSMGAEATAFLSKLDSSCPGWRTRDAFILQLDAETWNGDSSTRPTVAECEAFCNALTSRTSGKYVPVGYMPKWVYPTVADFSYPVWASSYVSGSGSFKGLYPGDDSSRWNSYGRPVSILQYSSSATIGGQTTCDANAYRGDLIQLKKLVTPGVSLMARIISDEDVQAIASKIGEDLTNDNSGIAKGVRKQAGTAVWNFPLEDPASTDTPKATKGAGTMLRYREAVEGTRTNSILTAIAQLTPATPEEMAAAFMAALGSEDDATIVAALKAALGDRAAEIGSALASE